MNRVHYTIQDRQQLPADVDWLTREERERYEGFRFPKRRGDWLLGRWAAKSALLGLADLAPHDIGRFEVVTAEDGAPQPRLDGKAYPATVSLSHSHDRAMAAVVPGLEELGCDIELIEPRSAGFVDTYFTAAEARSVAQARPELRDELITVIWSAKESTLKALRTGLRADTRSVEIVTAGMSDADWGKARATAESAGEFDCRWRRDGRFVLTVVTREALQELRLIAG